MQTQIVINNSELERQTFDFYFIDSWMKLMLNSYTVETRETKRHGWKLSVCYHRTLNRDNTINREDIPLTEAIKVEALRLFMQSITVE